ncbi:MAG: hypothetical protein FH748_07270 [Balneolaceae bacterium]|nr:hypothetical protein [Balneolaceae bacterium]
MKRGLFFALLAALLFTGTAFAQESQPEVTIVKYSDYQCPACRFYYNVEQKLKEELGDRVKLVTKHFPLGMHQYAQIAARAAEAARKQDKYHEMHELLFNGQPQWSRGNAEGIFIGYAKSLDLNVEQFRSDMNSAEMQRIVMADRREGIQLQVSSTPTFFVNGEKLKKNPPTYPAFKKMVESYMEN